MKFTSRVIGNQPSLTIEGHSVEHILSSRYFSIYTYDKKFDVEADDGVVKIIKKGDSFEDGMVIGWIKDE